MMIRQETVHGVFSGNCSGRIGRIEFKCVLSAIRFHKDKKIRVRNDNIIFFFIMFDFSEREEAADVFDILLGWIEISFIQ